MLIQAGCPDGANRPWSLPAGSELSARNKARGFDERAPFGAVRHNSWAMFQRHRGVRKFMAQNLLLLTLQDEEPRTQLDTSRTGHPAGNSNSETRVPPKRNYFKQLRDFPQDCPRRNLAINRGAPDAHGTMLRITKSGVGAGRIRPYLQQNLETVVGPATESDGGTRAL
jgi:hypothetical protein